MNIKKIIGKTVDAIAAKLGQTIYAVGGQREELGIYLEEVSALNPRRFYTANVMSIYGVDFDEAEDLIERGVQAGYFREGLEIVGPEQEAIEVVWGTRHDLPPVVSFFKEIDGHDEYVTVPTDELPQRRVYSLVQEN